MTFSFSTDFDLIRRILTDSRAWPRMVNDSAPERETFKVAPGNNLLYIVAEHQGEPAAVFVLAPMYPHAAEVHFCFVPELWRQTGKISRGFVSWIWRCTSLNTLFGPVPSYNAAALRLAQLAGFEVQETRIDAGVKDGKPFALIITGIERPNA